MTSHIACLAGKNTNTSQFFFTLAPAPQCDGEFRPCKQSWPVGTCWSWPAFSNCTVCCHLTCTAAGKHTVFGRVLEGLDILERISRWQWGCACIS
jgi:cyclophilin family peptidyl-prolyl cis-trans isomerase